MSATDPLVDVLCLDLDPDSGAEVATRRTFASVLEKLEYLEDLAMRDAEAAGVRREPVSREQLLDELARIRDAVARRPYESDMDQAGELEVLESPLHALGRGRGDCEDAATLGACLAYTIGADARIVALGGTAEEPHHCGLLVRPESPDTPCLEPCWWLPWEREREVPAGWYWSETTVREARLGEAPMSAARRAALERRG